MQSKQRPATSGTPSPNSGLDPHAFEAVYGRWAEPILRYLVRLVGPGPSAEDLFQETWIQALTHWDRLRDPQRIGSWLYRIAHNLAMNEFKRQGRRARWFLIPAAEREDEEWQDPLARAIDPTAAPDRDAMAEDQRRVLGAVLATLDGQTQEMLQLKYFEHLTLAEIAVALDLPPGTVAARIHRALRTMQQRLAGQGLSSPHAIL